MAHALESSIVSILNAQGQPVGAGFLAGERLALTCEHVARAAGAPAAELLRLEFPLLAGRPRAGARLAQRDEDADLAWLELVEAAPPGARAAELLEAEELWGHAFRAFGFPGGYDNGVWASGRILGREASGWLQIEDTKQTGYFVQPGFSGGPLWDEALGARCSAGARSCRSSPSRLYSARWAPSGWWAAPGCNRRCS